MEFYPKLNFFGVIMPLDIKNPKAQQHNDTRHQHTHQKPAQGQTAPQQKQPLTPGQTNPQRPSFNPQNPNQQKKK
jgi:hypothetical protein